MRGREAPGGAVEGGAPPLSLTLSASRMSAALVLHSPAYRISAVAFVKAVPTLLSACWRELKSPAILASLDHGQSRQHRLGAAR